MRCDETRWEDEGTRIGDVTSLDGGEVRSEERAPKTQRPKPAAHLVCGTHMRQFEWDKHWGRQTGILAGALKKLARISPESHQNNQNRQ